MHTKASDLSGGLKRRLSLALELLANRRVLFLGNTYHSVLCRGGLCKRKHLFLSLSFAQLLSAPGRNAQLAFSAAVSFQQTIAFVSVLDMCMLEK